MTQPESPEVLPPPEVIDVQPKPEFPALKELAGLTMEAGLAVAGATYRGVAGFAVGLGSALERVAAGPAGRGAAGILRAVVPDGGEAGRRELATAGRQAEERLSQVVSIVVPVVIDSVDIERIIEGLDVNALMARVDIADLVERVDLNAVLAEVDIDELVQRVDLNEVLAEVDVEALMQRIDVEALVNRVDIDALMSRVDIEALMERANIGDLVAESTGAFADSAVDLGRRQVVGLDEILMRLVNRTLGRKPDELPVGPSRLVEPEEEE